MVEFGVDNFMSFATDGLSTVKCSNDMLLSKNFRLDYVFVNEIIAVNFNILKQNSYIQAFF